MKNSTQPSRSSLFFLYILFFLSGFAALLYQVIWQRLIVFYTGSDTVSISLIVSAFMTGLGLGYLVGGRLSDRASAARNLRYFLLAEAGIMGFAALSKWVLYDVLYVNNPVDSSSPVVMYVVVFLVLLLPTFLMGFSLPALSRAFRFSDGPAQARYISLLYFVNTLGAAVGAFITGFVLVRQMGYESAIWVGVLFNGLCVVGAWGMGRGTWSNSPETTNTEPDTATEPMRFTPALTVWSVQYLLSGLAALSLELIWFRVLETLIKSVSLTFSVLLAVYLGSMALGTLVGVGLGRNARFKAPAARERLFLWAQTVLYVYTAASVGVFVNAIGRVPSLDFLWQYFKSGEPVLSPGFAFFTYGLMPLFLLFVPTFLMGLSFAVSQSLIQDRFEEVGRKVGWLQFVNIVGSAIGAWWVTWIGFPVLGTAALLKLIAGLGVVYGFVLFARKHLNTLAVSVLTVAQVLALLLIPDNTRFWQRLNGVDVPEDILFNENASGVSVIKLLPNHQSGVVFVNGLGQSGLPFSIDPVHTLLGALPVMIHPNPERVAVIGLGSGGTVHGMAGRAETRRIDCFEIVSNQAQIVADYGAEANDSTVNNLLIDKRLQLIFRDGRYALQHSDERYDVIEADALRPSSAFSGNVYSREYFQLLRSRLRPGGYAVTWAPTTRIRNTFQSVFPYVVYVDQLVLIGSNQPITVDWAAIRQRIESPYTQAHYRSAGIDLWGLLAKYQSHTHTIPGNVPVGPEINTDLFPKDEYSIRQRDKL
ncbi:spermine synthase [Rudanella paleaurantiibacter]|uniref:Spermine synthase n=1 Tax=Rudanella paleaurantiibacter TaxID=2614655 RepID=A0A7J5TWW2_9BACT|nr:spermine synthase [Rudanella paleaurantiibacter]KAB7728735.1 spermine synthase [Rudanella paleaurantiibacter]